MGDSQWFVENLNGNIPEGLDTVVRVEFSKCSDKSKANDGSKLAPEPKWGKSHSKDDGKSYGKDTGKGGYGKDSGKGGSNDPFSGYEKADSGKDAWDNQWTPYGQNGKDSSKGGEKGMKGLLKGAIESGITPWGERLQENCLHVSGLPGDCTDRDLYDLFAPFGAIAPKGVSVMMKGTECSGVGFVDFLDNACAQTASQSLNGFRNEDGSMALQVTPKRAPKSGGKGDNGKGK